ncbi:AraC family transcriptional regulator [Marivivens donghaensis]|uniref:AraC family transcriptional regulator n=1 Tax=Marivivens donghaensis TaxID=1699413 RepID=UPI00201EC943|nr:AraC family transcriptional regulator [Marivivens donghaensis]MCL7410024.1 AraC family transcriptional regulator [Marivivens donghaensis]MDN3705375.1 AraC family transcriptional regulator ligand-binding domain-containing protein [Marivivens donghaensis]
MKKSDSIYPTVSRAFIQDWVDALERSWPRDRFDSVLTDIGLTDGVVRVTHDQIVMLYQRIAIETGDEMVGLWGRPVRAGALKLLCGSVRDASSMSAALYRFVQYWNIVLDDVRLELSNANGHIALSITETAEQPANRFGVLLVLKLAHGIASWLAGFEVRLNEVQFGFEPPDFASDYPILFPCPVAFSHQKSTIVFSKDLPDTILAKSDAELREFLVRAPRDWIFTAFREHALSLRLREMVLASEGFNLSLVEAAQMMNVTSRTLMRRLDADGTTFQLIKDGVRRDVAMRELSSGAKSIEAIGQDVGFASAANFHRAFRRWTGQTPRAYQPRKKRE